MNELHASATDFNVWSLILEASLLVKLVMLTLVLASIISWYLIDRKRRSYARWTKIADGFEKQFWSGGDMRAIYQQWKDENDGIARIFISGYKEFNHLVQKPNIDNNDLVDGVYRSMRVALSREMDAVESSLSFLATVGSTSPYIGLFGTVWGIMDAFLRISGMQQVTIATVAPGIAEALIATAMGLFAAIPAVIAYNRFSNTAERLANRYEIFMEEFISIVSRQDLGAKKSS